MAQRKDVLVPVILECTSSIQSGVKKVSTSIPKLFVEIKRKFWSLKELLRSTVYVQHLMRSWLALL